MNAKQLKDIVDNSHISSHKSLKQSIVTMRSIVEVEE